MSNALRQSQRANLRESSGNGNDGTRIVNNANANDTAVYCVDLTPTQEQIEKEMALPTIMKVGDKMLPSSPSTAATIPVTTRSCWPVSLRDYPSSS